MYNSLCVLLFYVLLMKNIKEDVKFQKMKQTVQSILDKYLPSDKQFSVKNYNILYFKCQAHNLNI